jgi:hypothetical protein
MATLYAPRYGTATQQLAVPQAVGGGILNVAWSTYNFTVNPTAADVVKMLKLPARSTVVGGFLYGPDIDTGTDALDIDVGWAANGVESADPDGFGNMGVLNGAAITNLKPETGIWRPLGGVLFTTGPQFFTAETDIQLAVIAAAQAGGTGRLTLVVHFVNL